MNLSISEYAKNLAAPLASAGLTVAKIRELARQTGFMKRAPRKIDPVEFLCHLLGESVRGVVSYNDLAARLEATGKVSVSKQAIWKRVTVSCVGFVQAILALILAARLPVDENDIELCRRLFKRVLVQDSSVIRLPMKLFAQYSGVSNGLAQVCNARVQAVYDVLAKNFANFSVDAYSKNDLKAAPELKLQKGDLTLRDRGYLLNSEIQRHLEVGADCIYRHKYGTTYLDPKNGNPIDLAALLARDNYIDMEVLLNDDKKTKVRLVAAPVPEDIANLRRMKANKEKKGGAPSKEYLHMLSWSIFVTTITAAVATFKELLAIYGIRWRIETIFKTWKSNMAFDKIHNVSKMQLDILLAARLAMIVLTSHFMYRPLTTTIRKGYGRDLSLMKLTKYLVRNPEKLQEIILAVQGGTGYRHVFDALAKYCTYDRRRRQNFADAERELSAKLVLS